MTFVPELSTGSVFPICRKPRRQREDCLYKDGDMSGYLFKCIHCNKYHLWVDAKGIIQGKEINGKRYLNPKASATRHTPFLLFTQPLKHGTIIYHVS